MWKKAKQLLSGSKKEKSIFIVNSDGSSRLNQKVFWESDRPKKMAEDANKLFKLSNQGQDK